MNNEAPLLLVGAVAAVGVLHTIVPDHWVPITLIARQQGWSRRETALAALQAGTGHVLSTLVIALIVWFAGVELAQKFGETVDAITSLALVGFGGWIAITAWLELRGGGHGHSHSHGHPSSHAHHDHAHDHHGHEHLHGSRDYVHSHDHHEHTHDHDSPDADPLYLPMRGGTAVLARHVHIHRHGRAQAHTHWHDHLPETAHAIAMDATAPLHDHRHKRSTRTALLLILGSSPMVEGIPAFFAASRYGVGLIVVMSVVFAFSTILTYVLLCVYSTASLQRVTFGAFERYGEVASGAFIALVGIVFWLSPIACVACK